jgi:hypothetical protein
MKNEQFILETLTGRGPLLDLVLDELLKTTWWTGHKRLQTQLPSFTISFMLLEKKNWGLKMFKYFQNWTELYAVSWTLLLFCCALWCVCAHGLPTLSVTTVRTIRKYVFY